MTLSRTLSLAAALVLSFGLSEASAKGLAVAPAKGASTPLVSVVPAVEKEEEEDDAMDQLTECLDSDTLADCVNCCVDAFGADDPGMFYVCTEECSDSCESGEDCEDSEAECEVDLDTEVVAKPTTDVRMVSAKGLVSVEAKTKGSDVEPETDDPMDILTECLDSDTLAECVNCCLDGFVDDHGMFYVCVEECADSCPSGL
jgi:hypothetical protein